MTALGPILTIVPPDAIEFESVSVGSRSGSPGTSDEDGDTVIELSAIRT